MAKLLTALLLGIFLISFSSAGILDPGSELAFHEEGKNGKYGYYEINDTDFWFFNNKPVKTIELIENKYSIYTAWNIKEIEVFRSTKLFDKTNYLDKEQKEDKKNRLSSELHLFREWETKTRTISSFECLTYETTANQTQICTEYKDNSYEEEFEGWSNWQLYNFQTVQEGLYQTKTIVTRNSQGTGVIDWVDENEGWDLDKWATWWDNDWEKKREISNLTGNISALFSITYDADMKADFGDLRFLDNATESIELNYTIESFISSTRAEIRVNNLGTSSVMMYYDNPSVSTTGDAGSVYLEPVSAWYLDTNANDSIGNNNGTVTGAIMDGGYINGSYFFDGSGDKIDFGTGLNSFTTVTFALWMKAGTSQFQFSTPFMRGIWGNNGAFNLRKVDTGDNHISLDVYNLGGSEHPVSTSEVYDNTWHFIAGSIEPTNGVKLYVDGILEDSFPTVPAGWGSTAVGTTLIGTNGDNNRDYIGNVDELYIYNYELTGNQIYKIYTQTAPLFIEGAEQSNLGLSTTLISPEDAIQTKETLINFTFQSTPAIINLTNATLNIWNATDNTLLISNFTTLSGNESINTTFTNNLTQGNYLWGAITYGTAGKADESANRTLTIHTTVPGITIHDPQSLINYHLLGNNLTLNWTIEESGENLTTHITNCTYEYNETLTILNNTVCTQVGLSSFEYVLGINTLTFNVTDILGLVNSTTTTWDIKLIELNQTYDTPVTEGSLETFLANMRLDPGISITEAVLFSYDSSMSIGQSFISGLDTILRNADFLIPNVETDTNVTFYWSVTLSDSTELNLSFQNQTIQNLDIDNCSSFTNELFNFTVVDEEFQTILPNATIEVAVNLFDETRTEVVVNYSNLFQNINPLTICLNINISNSTTYSLDTVVRYENTVHANEYYNMVNQILTNQSTSQITTLYDLSLNDSTDFQLTFTGADFLPVENALVNVDRQYISENLFKTVELPKTDYNGQSVLHLVRNDVVYNVIITKGGVILGNFENLVAFCDDFTIGDCNIELNAFDSVEAVFDYDEALGIIFQAPTYNATQDLVSFVFVTSEGSAKEVVLEVTRNDIFGNRSVCNSSIISSGATLTCSTPSTLDDSQLNTQIYVNDILSVKTTVKISSSNYGVGGYFIAFVLALTLLILFSESKEGILFSMLLSSAVTLGLGITEGNMIRSGASGVWILIIFAIGIYKLNKDKQP